MIFFRHISLVILSLLGLVLDAPQSPGYWNNATILLPVFEYAKANYRVDANRLYLSGLCDGAVGTLNFASQRPGYLAGIMPIEAASLPTTGAAAGIKDLPMWAVHCFNPKKAVRRSMFGVSAPRRYQREFHRLIALFHRSQSGARFEIMAPIARQH